MLAERALAQLRRSLGEGEQPERPRSLFSQKRAASQHSVDIVYSFICCGA